MAKQKFDIDKVSKLAKLKLSDDEKAILGDQLNDILHYVDKLDEVNTDDVPPLRHVLEIPTPFRRDKAEPSLDRESTLMNAPEQENGYFKTPNVKT